MSRKSDEFFDNAIAVCECLLMLAAAFAAVCFGVWLLVDAGQMDVVEGWFGG